MAQSCKFLAAFDIVKINKSIMQNIGGLFIRESNIRQDQDIEAILEIMMHPGRNYRK